MAGLHVALDLPPICVASSPERWPAGLLDGIVALARGRAVERGARRLSWFRVHGLEPSAWSECGLKPEDLLPSDPAPLDLLTSVEEPLLPVSTARTRWAASAWGGLALHYDVPPGDFPSTWGSLHWQLWWHGGWRVRATLEYPLSAPRHDPRWAGWLAELEREAASKLAAGGG